MSLTEGLLNGPWLWIVHLFYSSALLIALYRLPWLVILKSRSLQHLFFGLTVLIMVMWTMRAGISPGLGIHFLGITCLTLILGWDLAIVSATLALLAMSVIGLESWSGFTVNGLCSIVLPAISSYLVLQWVERHLTKNFFVYLFVCGFFAAALSAAVAGSSTALLLLLDGVYDWPKLKLEYFQYLPLIMFPEALVNGILMTGIMVFYPDWIRTFDAKAYIDDQ